MRSLVTCLTLAALQSCAPRVAVRGSYVYFDPSVQFVSAGRTASQVRVFYQQEPDQPFEEIGIVEAVVSGYDVSLQDLLPELQRQAALMDSDAIHKIDLRRYDHAGEALHATAVGVRFVRAKK